MIKKIDGLNLALFDHRKDMGVKAASDIENKILELLKEKEQIRMIFASAPSQNDVLMELRKKDTIDWNRITAFHMDEYIGLPKGDSRLFSTYIVDTLFQITGLKNYHLIDPTNDPIDECQRYGDLIKEAPIDIVCLGIGENGHIAFNEPEYAEFEDKETMKIVTLDEKCCNQQVNDGCFSTIDEVPKTALTLTVPALVNANFLFCIVPGPTKKEVLNQLLKSEVTESLPCSILKRHKNCILYTDQVLESEK